MIKRRWIIQAPDSDGARELAGALGLSSTTAQLLVARGCRTVSDAHRFLNPQLSDLHDPDFMLGMKRSVDRILRAIDSKEKILVYGDYDVDGTTGTVVLRRALKLLGADSGFHVPHRFTEGYGIQLKALQNAAANGYSLVISVDCGIRDHQPLLWARENGLDVIVTDHHLPDDIHGAPPSFAVLNPNQQGCPYPDKNLAGVGVAFKLSHSLFRARGREELFASFLKMVAIGTVADVANLVGENRTIVSLGLSDLSQARNHGLRALMRVAGCGDGKGISATDLGFRLGPRINAAGRMDAAKAVVELFESETEDAAMLLAQHLDDKNKERRTVQSQIVELALGELGRLGDGDSCHVAVIAGDNWHRGVIGIAASKIAERINRPVIVISFDGDVGHGSARSIEAYHLLDGLTSCAHLLEKFGGHSHAAGLTIRRENLQALKEAVNRHAEERLSAEDLAPTLIADLEVTTEDLHPGLLLDLEKLEPFGAGNRRPVFVSRNARILAEPFVMKGKHLKLKIGGAGGRAVEAVWWDGVEQNSGRTPAVGDCIEMAYTVEGNIWQGAKRMQLSIVDLRRMNQG